MGFDLASITSGTRLRAPRIILLGVEKIGKSTFAANSVNPIFIPIKREEGIDDIPVNQFPVCNSVDDVRSALRTLHQDPHEFGTVVIDSSSALESLIWAEVCRKNGGVDSIDKVLDGYGKGQTLAINVWQEIADWIDALRRDREMASILVGHVAIDQFSDPTGPSYDRYKWDIHKHASAMLIRWADSILFANTKTIVKLEQLGFHKDNVKKQGMDITDGARFLYTQKRPAHPGGGRGAFGQLPYELPLTWAAFMDAVAVASQ